MESYSNKRLAQIKSEIEEINKEIKTMKHEKNKYELKLKKLEKDLDNGIIYYNNGEPLEEKIQQYEIQFKNLQEEIESLEENKKYKEKQINNISVAISQKSQDKDSNTLIEEITANVDSSSILS